MIFRVLDIETVPDGDAFTPSATVYKLIPGVTGDMRLVETEQFPPPHAQRVVAISYVDIVFDPAATPKYQFSRCQTDCRWSRDLNSNRDEIALLSDFGRLAAPDVHYVTWNGRTFDLPVIALRSLKHGIACKWYYDSKDVRYRYSAEGHLDLMDYWSDFGGARPMKLHDAARLIGLPGKTDMSGASIAGIYQASLADRSIDLEATCRDVARYCLQDSIQTAILFVRSRQHVGKITNETYNAVLETFSSSPAINEAITLDWNRLKL